MKTDGKVNDDGNDAGKQGKASEIFNVIIPSIMAVAEDEGSEWERRKKNPKRMGEVSQAAFLLKARALGFGVAVPWGDSEKYDFIV